MILLLELQLGSCRRQINKTRVIILNDIEFNGNSLIIFGLIEGIQTFDRILSAFAMVVYVSVFYYCMLLRLPPFIWPPTRPNILVTLKSGG